MGGETAPDYQPIRGATVANPRVTRTGLEEEEG